MGKNGEGWVILQIICLGLVAFVPSFNDFQLTSLVQLGFLSLGTILAVLATVFMIWSFWELGANLRAPPDPKQDNRLITTGPYSWVRHPIYFSLILLSLAWQIVRVNPLGLVWIGLLFLVLYFKSQREEKRLHQIHPEYAQYQQNVPRFFPRLGGKQGTF
jgi:protein-S-isoprenylcysteine O-methyltransferase Ste14